MKRKTAIAIAVVVAVGLVAGILLPGLGHASNCGHNSYALFACREYTRISGWATAEGKTIVFEFGETDKADAARLAKSHWIGGTDFLIKTNLAGGATLRQVVIVCEKSFDNVPQPSIWNFYRKNPAHAVGYSDGSTGLISLSEFQALDKSGFVPLSSLAPTPHNAP